MEANELRIGNYVSNEKGAPIVIDGRSIFDLWSKTGILKYLPIPITEEWLLRFGFERGCPYSKEKGFTFPCEGFFFEKDVNLVLEESSGRPITVVEFVHDLQNLYFALTGEELKINEK